MAGEENYHKNKSYMTRKPYMICFGHLHFRFCKAVSAVFLRIT